MAQMGSKSMPCADGGISQATAGGGNAAAITHDGGEGSMRGQSGECNHSARVGGHEVVVGGSGEVEGCLAHSFSQGSGCKVVVAEGLAWIGHGGGQQHSSQVMGLRWQQQWC